MMGLFLHDDRNNVLLSGLCLFVVWSVHCVVRALHTTDEHCKTGVLCCGVSVMVGKVVRKYVCVKALQ